ncbi:MAG: ketosamine-3-kinase, partial [Chitinophagaceae bacterium]
VGGGSINNTYRISFDSKSVFCKINSATKFPQLFSKEKAGLELIATQGIIKTPSVIDCFENDDEQVLLMEWIQEGERTESFWKIFGQQLAAVDQISSESFGLDDDNYMGSIPQSNRKHNDWIPFFINERLQPMARRCFDKNLLAKNHLQAFENLQQKLPGIFEKENPSLLHGDLWSGNFMCNRSGEPVLIDPAVYYGHRSVDLAMTTLFGGFRQPFYEAYHYHFPLPKNHEEQWAVCNLYPLLIHLYLFGSSYLPQIERTLSVFA